MPETRPARLLLIAFGLLLPSLMFSCRAPEPAALAAGARANDISAAWRDDVQRDYDRGVTFLVQHQNPDGSFGTFESARPYEIYRGTIASFRAFRDASSALCVMALQTPSRSRPDAADAFVRGAEHLLSIDPVGRATPDTFYDTWTHTFVLQALARLATDDRFADRRDEIDAAVKRTLDRLVNRQGADGGWAYYDFGHGYRTPSGILSTSFNTASVLVAFHELEAAGYEVDPRVVRDALRCVSRLRLPSGAYVYATQHRMIPGRDFNMVKGSLARAQPCNYALWLYDHGVSAADIALGLARLREHHHFLTIAYGRPRPHEAWYQNSGYYVLYGHYYAALAARALEPEERSDALRWQAATIADLQNADGSWYDFPMYGYHYAYGTAFALLTLEEALRE